MQDLAARSLCAIGRSVLFLVSSVLTCGIAFAHDSRPLYIQIIQLDPTQYELWWKTPPSIPDFAAPTLVLPEECHSENLLSEPSNHRGLVGRAIYLCEKDIAGKPIVISYPGGNPSISSLIRYTTYRGERHVAVLGPDQTSWTIPRTETASSVAGQYLILGGRHVLSGIDHLLFLVCLLWIARGTGRILLLITGFTLAHSVTLILAASKIINLPVPPVEATIALSIVFLANELVVGPRRNLIWHYPIAVSSAFGLLHGFGFAAALIEVGLPQTEMAIGLLFFNIGVEIGQLFFVTIVTVVVQFLRCVRFGWLRNVVLLKALRTAAGYGVGIAAMFWVFERSAVLLRGGMLLS